MRRPPSLGSSGGGEPCRGFYSPRVRGSLSLRGRPAAVSRSSPEQDGSPREERRRERRRIRDERARAERPLASASGDAAPSPTAPSVPPSVTPSADAAATASSSGHLTPLPANHHGTQRPETPRFGLDNNPAATGTWTTGQAGRSQEMANPFAHQPDIPSLSAAPITNVETDPGSRLMQDWGNTAPGPPLPSPHVGQGAGGIGHLSSPLTLPLAIDPPAIGHVGQPALPTSSERVTVEVECIDSAGMPELTPAVFDPVLPQCFVTWSFIYHYKLTVGRPSPEIQAIRIGPYEGEGFVEFTLSARELGLVNQKVCAVVVRRLPPSYGDCNIGMSGRVIHRWRSIKPFAKKFAPQLAFLAAASDENRESSNSGPLHRPAQGQIALDTLYDTSSYQLGVASPGSMQAPADPSIPMGVDMGALAGTNIPSGLWPPSGSLSGPLGLFGQNAQIYPDVSITARTPEGYVQHTNQPGDFAYATQDPFGLVQHVASPHSGLSVYEQSNDLLLETEGSMGSDVFSHIQDYSGGDWLSEDRPSFED